MTLNRERAGAIALESLLPRTRLSAAETARRFEEAVSPAYWQALCPHLTVNGDSEPTGIEKQSLSAPEQEKLVRQFRASGYFQSQPLLDHGLLERMCAAIEVLRREDWPEVFAFVYDEFWQITRTPSVGTLLSEALGAAFRPLPHVVVHYVKAEVGSGWRPHVDFSDRTDRFTLWVALNDATLAGGCMYLVPRDRVSLATHQKFIATEQMNHKEIQELLQGSHALPAVAGSFLGWDPDVIHWGTSSSMGAGPRISLSVVYLKAGASPLADELPLLDPVAVPNFAQRLFSIAKALTYYNIHVLSLRRFADLAGRLRGQFKKAVLTQ
jgi:Phytanoyl-CoA dioxygenase (PhyH)